MNKRNVGAKFAKLNFDEMKEVAKEIKHNPITMSVGVHGV